MEEHSGGQLVCGLLEEGGLEGSSVGGISRGQEPKGIGDSCNLRSAELVALMRLTGLGRWMGMPPHPSHSTLHSDPYFLLICVPSPSSFSLNSYPCHLLQFS